MADFFPGVDSIASLHVEGENRLLGVSVSLLTGGSLLSYPVHSGTPKVLDPDPDLTYFLVGHPKFGMRTSETFVIALSEPEDIAQARKILVDPSERKIVVGSIAYGHGGHNRNLTEVAGSGFSWHVDQFLGFADFAVEVCDGGPMNVEFDLAYWIETVEQVCFWTPTVVRELRVEEVRTTGLLTLAPVGLTPTEHTSLRWTHSTRKTPSNLAHSGALQACLVSNKRMRDGARLWDR